MAFDSSDPVALEGTWPLVGRTAVVERVLAVLLAGSRAVALYGASGVGRSRIAAEVVEALEDDGWMSVTIEGNPALPPVPLATIAPALAPEMSAPLVRAEDGDALFAAARGALRRIGDGRRLLVVLDDAAAADPVSVALIARLAEEDGLQVLVTLDRGDPAPDGMQSVLTAESAVRIEVRELDADETEQLLVRVLGATVAAGAVAELHRVSGGNPLFLRELVIAASASGTLIRGSRSWRLADEGVGSPGLKELIRGRLGGLTHEELDVVQRLSLCQPLALDEFARPGAPEAIADLEQRGLVRVQEARGRIRMFLAHPQHGAAIRETIPRARHVSLLAQQADVVARRSPSPADDLRVAVWRLDARRPSDPDLLLRSACLAEETSDHRFAERLVSAAISSGADTSAVHLLHARSLQRLLRLAEASSAVDRADERALGAADADAVAVQRAEIRRAGADAHDG